MDVATTVGATTVGAEDADGVVSGRDALFCELADADVRSGSLRALPAAVSNPALIASTPAAATIADVLTIDTLRRFYSSS